MNTILLHNEKRSLDARTNLLTNLKIGFTKSAK